jgi:integrase
VEQTRHYIPQIGDVINPPKTEQSRRTLKISLLLTNMLIRLKHQQEQTKMKMGEQNNNTNFVFVSNLGNPLYAGTLSSWFPKFLHKHELPHPNFHGLWHTSATNLNAKELDITTISRRLGHSNKMTTLKQLFF